MIVENRFYNQVAVVTGAARGIGMAIAERLTKEGAKVVLMDLLKDPLNETVTKIKKINNECFGLHIDISDEQAVNTALLQVVETFGRLDIMINCAGIVGATGTKITDYDSDLFRKIIDINLTGAFYLTKSSIPHMLKNSYGRVLHITSIGGKEGNPGMVGYAASKSGMIGLVKGIGKEYADTGITVNGLAPAVIATPMNLETDKEMLDYMTSKIPMQRLGTMEEAAAISCWIVSKEASFNTGFVFDLSGGRATY